MKCNPFKFYGTLHTSTLRVQCVFKNPACCIFGLFKGTSPNDFSKRKSTHPQCVFDACFESRVQVSQVHDQSQQSRKQIFSMKQCKKSVGVHPRGCPGPYTAQINFMWCIQPCICDQLQLLNLYKLITDQQALQLVACNCTWLPGVREREPGRKLFAQ